MTDLYALLGIPRDATDAAVTKAYRKLAAKLHPDRNPGDAAAEARFKEVQHAYDVLRDPARRARYDATGRTDDAAAKLDVAAATLLSNLLAQAVNDVSEVGGNAEFTNMLGCVHDLLNAHKAQAEKQRKQMTKVLNNLDRMRGRFAPPKDGADVLGEAARYHRASVAGLLAALDEQGKVHARAAELLEGASYRTDEKRQARDSADWMARTVWMAPIPKGFLYGGST